MTADFKVEKHPGPFLGPDADLARACAMAVIPWYGTDDEVTHQRIMQNGIWNDHVAVQSALAAIHYLTVGPMVGRGSIERGQRVLVWATVQDPTTFREPSGMWWVAVDGCSGYVALHEDAMIKPVDTKKAPEAGPDLATGA
jgi:hypothetical protein